MHWYKFKILLNGLDNTTALGKRIELRSLDISSIKNTKLRTQILKAKKEIALVKKDKRRSPEEKQRDFNKSFSKMFF